VTRVATDSYPVATQESRAEVDSIAVPSCPPIARGLMIVASVATWKAISTCYEAALLGVNRRNAWVHRHTESDLGGPHGEIWCEVRFNADF
jgi:hypothetical protein